VPLHHNTGDVTVLVLAVGLVGTATLVVVIQTAKGKLAGR
jgi:hypothetical protein